MSEPANLVIQTAFLGDLILSVPVLKRIKIIFPGKKLVLVCKKGIGEFLVRDGIVDRIIEIEKSNSRSYSLARRELSNYHIEHLFCLHRSLRSQLFSARIAADRKIGFTSVLGYFIYNDQVRFQSSDPEAIRQWRILLPVDAETSDQLSGTEYSFLNVPGTLGRLAEVPEFFSFKTLRVPERSRGVAVFPGSVWATKKWTREGFTELIQKLLKDGLQVHLMGGPAERNLCEEIAADCPGAVVTAGKFSVAESISELQRFDLVICNDSASAHMAAYQGVPVISIFGPTVSAMGFRPWSNHAYIIENSTMSCRPCGKHGHHQCPLGHHLCMKSISAAEVYQRASALMGNSK